MALPMLAFVALARLGAERASPENEIISWVPPYSMEQARAAASTRRRRAA